MNKEKAEALATAIAGHRYNPSKISNFSINVRAANFGEEKLADFIIDDGSG